MKVKTFAGSETAKVDKRVNDWLARFGIKPHHTNTAIGAAVNPSNARAAMIWTLDSTTLIPKYSAARYIVVSKAVAFGFF